ncbi:MAG TPA: aminodeoxychorismate/anthranilate synthase component II [Patescibacteria group bacterium]|jgi:anthranilate synthase component 2|nr:aminodeoxychorismate/anthranilate synthase component II [Patescibacteria group bacterium]
MLAMIDNYDSFTWNLVQYFGDLGAPMEVFRNDKISVNQLFAMRPEGIVISPGPSDPDHAGICLETIERAAETKTPLLGVCLGHQAIGQAFGGRVIRAPKPMHGKLSEISHTDNSVFAGLPSPYTATRYHSLIVERDTLPDDLEVTAETDDGLIMGLAHKTLPIHGIQFHPESIATQHGHALLKNFVQML